jgi:hypothetical protein
MGVRRERQSAWCIFAVPVALAGATVVGLLSGLLGDGAYDLVAAIGLGLPVLAIAVRLIQR